MTIDDINITVEKNNAKQHAKVFYAKHMEPGLAQYHNEMLLVNSDAMKSMIPSFAGKPVYVQHQTVDLENLQTKADGYVSECFYNDLDGWLWNKIIVVSDAGQEAVLNGWSVSNAYIPKKWNGCGSYHNIDFDREIVNAEFTHLAIVPNPRYENAKILTPEQFKQYQDEKRAHLKELHNSKGRSIMKIFRSKKEEVTNSAEILDTDVVTLADGKEISIKEMLNAVEENEKKIAAEKLAEEEKKNALSAKEFDVNGAKITFEKLKEFYLAIEKQNAHDTEKKAEADKKEKEDAAAKEQADKEAAAAEAKKAEDKKLEDEEKKNAKNFDELKNAGGPIILSAGIETSQEKIARGKLLY